MEIPGVSSFLAGISNAYMLIKSMCHYIGILIPVMHGYLLSNLDANNGLLASIDVHKNMKEYKHGEGGVNGRWIF